MSSAIRGGVGEHYTPGCGFGSIGSVHPTHALSLQGPQEISPGQCPLHPVAPAPPAPTQVKEMLTGPLKHPLQVGKLSPRGANALARLSPQSWGWVRPQPAARSPGWRREASPGEQHGPRGHSWGFRCQAPSAHLGGRCVPGRKKAVLLPRLVNSTEAALGPSSFPSPVGPPSALRQACRQPAPIPRLVRAP